MLGKPINIPILYGPKYFVHGNKQFNDLSVEMYSGQKGNSNSCKKKTNKNEQNISIQNSHCIFLGKILLIDMVLDI